ncbi:MAG: family 16 glycosylhydrolase [Planctomycetota bacterium]
MQRSDILFGGFAVGFLAAVPCWVSAQDSEVIFFDDFDGPLDTSVWQAQPGTGSQYGLNGWGNNELQYYRGENAWTQDGKLIIEARRENFAGRQYTSARLRTKDALDFTYGTVEASIKIPSSIGIWPAFWMLPTDSPYGGWPASGEIDIMESFDFDEDISGTLHYGTPHTFFGGSIGGLDFDGEFHTYRVDWEPGIIRWYLDGELFYARTQDEWFSSSAPDDPNAPFDSPFHIILNVAVGGNPVGTPNPADFPQRMEVEWVRVTQPEQGSFGFVNAQIPGTIEAENFDVGYNGQAYFDTSPGNDGNADYRPDTDVDIEVSSDGGFNIGFIEDNEFLEYAVTINEPGTYRVDASVASQNSAGTFRLEFDGVDKTGPVATPVTGGWQTFKTVSAEVELEAGDRVMRFQQVPGFFPTPFNISSFTFTKIDEACAADLNGNGQLAGDDFNAWLIAFLAGDLAADLNNDGQLAGDDFNAWLGAFLSGC